VVWVTRLPDGRDHLVALSLVGERSPRRLGPGRDPAFGPDGHWVVFSAWIGDRWQLWRIRPDGTGRARVGTGALDEVQPAVSPDGRHVAYVVEEDHRSSLYLRRLDGSGDRILFRDGDAESPVW
jgi:TolB protein